MVLQQLMQIQFVMLVLILILSDDDYIDYGPHLTKAALITNEGMGRGVIKTIRRRYAPIDFYDYLCRNDLFVKLLYLFKSEFDDIVLSINTKLQLKQINSLVKCIDGRNKVLLTLLWIIRYPRYSQLMTMFGVSEFCVSVTIREILPLLVGRFVREIHHKRKSCKHSSLSNQLCFIIDGTIHPIYKPKYRQKKFYRGDKMTHFINTLLLIDYDQWICAVTTNYPGHLSDQTCAKTNTLFRAIVGRMLALGDPGFEGVDYCVAGLKSNLLKTDKHRLFDRISRSEQAKVENVNNFIKRCQSISKNSRFLHNRALLTGCVLICCGIYNWRKKNGFFMPNPLIE